MKLHNLKELYTEAVSKMLVDSEYWKNFLQYASNMYGYNFSTLVTLYAQQPELTQFATYAAWNHMGLQIKRGERSIPALMNNRYGMAHMFDASQLATMPKIKNWKIEDNDRKAYDELFVKENRSYTNSFTKSTNDIIGSMIIEQMNSVVEPREKEEYKDLLIKASRELFTNVDYMIKYRCNSDEIGESASLSHFNLSLDEFSVLGRYIMNISRPILLNCKNVVNQMRKEQYHEREPRENRNGLHGEGRNPIRQREGRTGGTVHATPWQVRNAGEKVLGGEQGNSAGTSSNRGNHDEDHAPDRGQGERKNGATSEGNASEGPSQESREHDGVLSLQTEDTRSGGGNRDERDSVQLELDFEDIENNTVIEKEALNVASFLIPKSYGQKRISDQEQINYHYKKEHKLYDGGIKTKFQNNIAAIQLLKDVEKNHRIATSEEQIILANYVGWGGMAGVFDEKSKSWANEYLVLKELLSEKEYVSARASTNTAFYTSPDIIQGIYKALSQFGFQGGNILEPSMGIGNFFSVMPEEIQSSSHLYGVELDEISGRIAKQLYQTAEIQVCGYENSNLQNNFFDIAIGNIPFGDYKVFDEQYKKHNFKVHDYFLAKTLDKLRVGGIMAMVTSTGTLDKANPTVRRYLAERADLIGAIRLPNTAFKKIANTEVSSDILFLQKREKLRVAEPEWVYTGLTEDDIPVNQYFLAHPAMLLGKMVYDTRMFGEGSKYTTVENLHPEHLQEDFQEAVDKLLGHINVSIVREENSPEDAIPADPNVKNYCYTVINEKVYYRQNSIMVSVKLSSKREKQAKGLINIRIAARKIIEAEMDNGSDEDLKRLQRNLTEYYDDYVRQYGYLSDKASRFFRNDADYPLLLSLENERGKADIFYKRTIQPVKQIEHVDTVQEGLIVSMNEKGRVDIDYIAQLAGVPESQVVESLEGQVFLNPEKYDVKEPFNGYVSADEYLCGNVRDKLKVAELFAKSNPIFQKNVEALNAVQPRDLEASEISIRLGTTWIDENDYNMFIYELLDTPRYNRFYGTAVDDGKETRVYYNKHDSSFSISNKVGAAAWDSGRYGGGEIK